MGTSSSELPPPRITEPGVYEMPDLEYHSDPVAAAPSLSRSIAKRLVEASPAHAYAQHPRLGGTPPTGPASGEEEMELGSAAHAMFLQGLDIVEHIPFDSYRTKDAKEMRDNARSRGMIPLKTKAYNSAKNLYEALEEFRDRTGYFTQGRPEQTVIWDEGDHWGRCRIDWLPDDPAAPLLDLKTTGGLATLAGWGRTAFQFGADLQAAMYPRACEFVRHEAPNGMLFVVAETSPPYAIRVFGLDDIAVDVGRQKAAAARAIWIQCLALGQWPSYPLNTEWILPPPWEVRNWEETRIGGMGRATEDTAFIEKMIRLGSWGG
jgi:hypothetical protein